MNRLPSCCSLMLLMAMAGAPADAALYSVTGVGSIFDPFEESSGVDGEQVMFTFTYDDADFSNGTAIAAGGREFGALVSIPVTAVGSISGVFPVDDISFVTAFNSSDFGYTIDQWNYQSGINGLVQADNFGGAAFTSVPAAVFADTNELFVNQLNTTSLWAFSTNMSFGLDSAIGLGQTLQLIDATAMVTVIPEPGSLVLAVAAGIGLLPLAWRRRDRGTARMKRRD